MESLIADAHAVDDISISIRVPNLARLEPAARRGRRIISRRRGRRRCIGAGCGAPGKRTKRHSADHTRSNRSAITGIGRRRGRHRNASGEAEGHAGSGEFLKSHLHVPPHRTPEWRESYLEQYVSHSLACKAKRELKSYTLNPRD